MSTLLGVAGLGYGTALEKLLEKPKKSNEKIRRVCSLPTLSYMSAATRETNSFCATNWFKFCCVTFHPMMAGCFAVWNLVTHTPRDLSPGKKSCIYRIYTNEWLGTRKSDLSQSTCPKGGQLLHSGTAQHLDRLASRLPVKTAVQSIAEPRSPRLHLHPGTPNQKW